MYEVVSVDMMDGMRAEGGARREIDKFDVAHPRGNSDVEYCQFERA